jgi:hypothetical protein
VLGAGIASAGDLGNEEIAAGFGTEDGVEVGARLFQLGSVGVVVERGQVGEYVLPAAVVVDAPGGIENPGFAGRLAADISL